MKHHDKGIEPALDTFVPTVPVSVAGPLSLRENFSWALTGNVVYAGCQWGMLVILARIGSPIMVGQFALGLAVCAPVFIFANLQLRSVQATDARREYRFEDYFGLRLVALCVALLIVAGVVVLSGYRRETAIVILAVGGAKAIESVSDLYYGLFQQRERLDRIAKSMVIKGPFGLTCFGVAILLTGKVFWAVVALLCAWIIVLIAYDIPNGRYVSNLDRDLLARTISAYRPGNFRYRSQWAFRPMISLAWVALPLGMVMFLNSLGANIPQYFVESNLGEHGLGIFSALAYLIVGGGTVMNALFQSASPRLAVCFAEGRKTAFLGLIVRLMVFGIVVGACMVLAASIAGRSILGLLYGPEYSLYTDVFLWLMIFAAIQYFGGALSVGVTAMRRFWIQAPINAIGVVLTFVLSGFLIPRFGMVGAVWSMLIPYCLNRIGFGIVLIGHCKEKGNQGVETCPIR